MARTDVIVLGAGIVGTSVAVHLAKRGLSVALVDRGGAGEGTSYGNAGIIEGNTIFPAAFPSDWATLLRVALKRSPLANYHFTFLPKVAPWLLAFRAASQPARLVETAQAMRPLFARAVSEHDALSCRGRQRSDTCAAPAGSSFIARDAAFAGLARELDLAASLGIANVPLDRDAARALEPSLKPVFRHAVHWTGAVSVSNPLALTRAYAARFAALGGLSFTGDARTLHRVQPHWRVDTASGPLDAGDVVIALGPWLPDVLDPLGIKAAACGQARLSPPLQRSRQCRARPSGARCRERLLPGADGAGHPVDHRRRVRRARRAADAGAVRAPAAGGTRTVCARRAGRGGAMAWRASVLCRFPSGDRARAGPLWIMARLRTCPLGIDARSGDRPAPCRDDDRRDALLRSAALRRGTFHALETRMASSQWAKPRSLFAIRLPTG